MIKNIFEKFGYSKTIFITLANNRVEVLMRAREKQVLDINELKKSEVSIKENLHNMTIKYENQKKKFISKSDELNRLQNNLHSAPKNNKNRLQRWSRRVRATKICDCCSKSCDDLQAHHLWSKALHPTLAYETTNGVALCPTCHEGYHKKYTHIEDCNPYTYNEFKIDENTKTRLLEVEKEVKVLKALKSKTIKEKVKAFLKL